MVDVVSTIFTGLCNGVGTMIGGYLATKYAFKRIDEVDYHIRKKIKKE